jgi:MFS family permease
MRLRRSLFPFSSLWLSRWALNYNWMVTGAILPALIRGLPATPWQIAVIVAAVPIGQGISEIPSGLLAFRFDPRHVTVLGGVLLGLCAVGSALSVNWPTMAALRLGVGLGSGLFWPSSLALLRDSSPFRGLPTSLGVYNASGALGLVAALVGGLAIEEALGWRWSLLVGGAGQLFFILLVAAIFRKGPSPLAKRSTDAPRPGRSAVLRSQSLWALALAGAGTWAAAYVIPQYAVTFASLDHPEWGLSQVALAVSAASLLGVPAGILGGMLASRTGKLRAILATAGLATAGCALLFPFVDFASFTGLLLLFGTADGLAFAVLYALPAYIPEVPAEGLPLAIGMLDSIETFTGSALALGFGLLVGFSGFGHAWIAIGLAAAVPIGLLAWVRTRRSA